MRLIVLGAGHLGSRIATLSERTVLAVTQTESRHEALRSLRITPTTTWPTPTAEDHLVLSLSGSALQGDAVARLSTGARPARAVLVSTMGFHAPYRGSIRPDGPPGTSERAKVAAATEAAFSAWMGDVGTIVRLGGLWTDKRGPLAAFARTGKAREGPPDARIPLIHYDDAARLIHRVLQKASPPVVLGVVECPTRRVFYEAAATALSLPVPAFAEPENQAVSFEDAFAEGLIGDPLHPDWRTALLPQ